MRRIAWFGASLVVVVACIEPRDSNRPQQQAQAQPPPPPPGYYPPPGQYPPGQYPPGQYPPQQYPPQQGHPQQPPPQQPPSNQQRPPQPGPTGQPAPQPTQQQPAPQPTQQPPPANAPGTWGGMLDHLLGGGAPPLQWPPAPAPTPTTAPTTPPTPPPAPGPQVSQRSLDLANAINNYRKQNNLPPIPISKSLSAVAETHVKDLRDSAKPAGNCNGHSWSNKGSWTPCCYTPDHAQAKCMWAKPGELTQMKATGFEITIGQPGEANAGTVLDSNKAISMWQGSALHNDVILNRGQWQAMHWKAMGAGIIDSHACAWFSDQSDPVP
jgi:uncharacterized protein YkwD